MNEIINMLTKIRPECDFTDSSDFIEDGMLDSFDIISLISMIEEKHNIKIDGLDIVPENFCNVEKIIGLVRKTGGSI